MFIIFLFMADVLFGRNYAQACRKKLKSDIKETEKGEDTYEKNYKYSDCLFYICNGRGCLLLRIYKMERVYRTDDIRRFTRPFVSDGNVVIFADSSFCKDNDVGGKSFV